MIFGIQASVGAPFCSKPLGCLKAFIAVEFSHKTCIQHGIDDSE